MEGLISLGLDAADKLLEHGFFDNMPDRIAKGLAADPPVPKILKHKKDKDKSAPRSRPRSPSPSTSSFSDDYTPPSRRRTFPRSRSLDHDRGHPPYPTDTSTDLPPPPGAYSPEQTFAPPRRAQTNYEEAFYAPNPDYYTPERPWPIVARRSQSHDILHHRYHSPSPPSSPSPSRHHRRHGRRARSSSRDYNRKHDTHFEKFLGNKVATGVIGAAAGGLIANQLGRATGIGGVKDKRHGIGGDDAEIAVTVAGMVVGGIGAAVAGEKLVEAKRKAERKNREWEARFGKGADTEGRGGMGGWEKDDRSIRMVDREGGRGEPVYEEVEEAERREPERVQRRIVYESR